MSLRALQMSPITFPGFNLGSASSPLSLIFSVSIIFPGLNVLSVSIIFSVSMKHNNARSQRMTSSIWWRARGRAGGETEDNGDNQCPPGITDKLSDWNGEGIDNGDNECPPGITDKLSDWDWEGIDNGDNECPPGITDKLSDWGWWDWWWVEHITGNMLKKQKTTGIQMANWALKWPRVILTLPCQINKQKKKAKKRRTTAVGTKALSCNANSVWKTILITVGNLIKTIQRRYPLSADTAGIHIKLHTNTNLRSQNWSSSNQ